MKSTVLALSKLAPLVLVSTLYSVTAHAKPDVVRYQEYPGSILHLNNWVMNEKGLCKKYNLDCQPIMLANGPLAQQAAAARSVDLIVSSMDVMLQAKDKGNDLMVVGPVAKNNLYSLSVRAEYPQPNAGAGYPDVMKDLVNARIGVTARGSATEMYVKTLMRGAGLPHKDIVFIGVGAPASAYSALMAKQVDAILSWDPIPAICDATKTCSVAVDMRKDEGPDTVKAMNNGFLVWQARREYVQDNAPIIDRFLSAQSEAFTWLKDPDNLAEAKQIAAKHFKLGEVPNSEEVAEQVISDMIGMYDTTLKPEVVDGFNQFLLDNELISKEIDKTDLFYTHQPAS